jgi:Xaa-Pro aminopeptidase
MSDIVRGEGMKARKSKPELTTQEKKRRWSLLKKKLREAGLEGLVVYGGSQLGVPVRYLTNAWGNKGNAVIFPVEGEPRFLIPTDAMQNARSLIDEGCWLPEEDVHLSAHLASDLAKHLKELKLHKSRVGIDSLLFWPARDYMTVTELCPGLQPVEAHRLFGEIRGPKSDEELALMEKAIHISDLAHYAFVANFRPGMSEAEAAAKANEVLEAHGVGDRIILIHTQPDMTYPHFPGARVIRKSDVVIFSPEFTRKLGYGAQMIRAYCWAPPKGTLKRMYSCCAELRQMVLEEFRPGLEIVEAGQRIKELVSKWGFESLKLGHAVGLSYGDAPYITADPQERDFMEWTILSGEVYAVHPMIRNKGGKPPFAMTGDMFLVGEKETRWLTTALPGIPEILP